MIKFLRNAKLFFRLCENNNNLYGDVSQMKTAQSVCPLRYLSSNTEADRGNRELDFHAISQGNSDLEHKLKVLLLEAEVMRQEGRNVPSLSYIKTHHWQELLKLETRTARSRYLQFLFKVEKKKENESIRKEQKRLDREQNPREERVTDHLRYDLGYNNILLRVYDSTMNNLYNNKLIEAIQFGQKLVVDCGYDKNMTSRENVNCAKQLMLLFAENRGHEDPFDLHFCNCNKESTLLTSLHRHIKTMYEPWFPLHLHKKSYLEIFPKEQLVYLTPHCREEMKDYDHEAVYIVGGLVDKVNNEPLSLAKAKEERLRMLKLPLDRYLQWGSGSGKNLTLNQVVAILLDIKRTGDWNHALRHVPRRKLVDYSLGSAIDKAGKLNNYQDYTRSKTDKFNLRYNSKRRKHQEHEETGVGSRAIRSIFND